MDALSTEREREMENCVTTESVVLSMTNVNQKLTEVEKAIRTDKCPISGAIVQSMASIHKLFKDVMRTSNSIQRVYSDMVDLALKIQIQQVAFENGCKMLLVTAAKSRQDVDNMIEDQGHPIWKDTIAHQNVDIIMARFYHVCLAALKRFQESLDEVRVGLHTLRRQGTRNATSRYQFWLDKSNPPNSRTAENFPELVQKLRSYNDIFCTLIWLAVPRRSGYQFESSFGGNLSYPYALSGARAPQHHFDNIQRASQDLYDTLSNIWTCREHKAHCLNIALNLDHINAGAIVPAEDFRFNVTVTSPYFESPYRLIVHTAHSDICRSRKVKGDRFQTNFWNRVIGPAIWTKSFELSELDIDTAALRPGCQRARNSTRAESRQRKVPNLGLEEDLCYWLRKSCAAIEPKQETESSCLGFLETRSGFKFLFFYVHREKYQKQGSYSLDDVLKCANNERREIRLEDRLRTALSLAAGVLHLSTSSWLRQVWSSKDIHFFGVNSYGGCTLGEPFFKIESNNDTTRGPVYENKSHTATRSCLLSLGLVLIELAFSAPWCKLQLEENLTKDLCEWERNFLDLTRLSDTVSRELGSRYAKVVQTCLLQGWGTPETPSLGKAELDEVIFEDIVRELDRCVSAVTFEPDS